MKKLFFILLTFFLIQPVISQDQPQRDNDLMRLYEVYTYIKRMYVDSVDTDELSKAAINGMLKQLDPHTTFIPKENVEIADRQINGSYVGVGIRFNILDDTLLVVNTIPGGPSEKVGIRAGDKIIKVDEENIAGIGLTNGGVRERLLGEKGSKVFVLILRDEKIVEYTITRDKIPLHSVIASYMVNEKVGYIKLTHFSRTTAEEIKTSIKELKKQGMEKLILDLLGNGGGLLYAAKSVADEFLTDDKLIVYSKGRMQPKQVLKSTKEGEFEKGKLIILVNEYSASASEIVAGSIQDWDRGLIVGRRSFGKGLVERPIPLSDGSELRLTIARYYTPTGRWIQKPYENLKAYHNDYITRFKSGELMYKDSIDFPDSLKYKTLIKHRTVFGGGGIMPDIFVALDTSEYSDYYRKLGNSGTINSFSLEYANNNRKKLERKYENVEAFNNEFLMDDELMNTFFDYATEKDTLLAFDEEGYKEAEDLLKCRLKATIAQNIWGYEAFYQIYNRKNEIISRAISAFKDGTFEKMNLER